MDIGRLRAKQSSSYSKGYVVPARIFREDLSSEERFALPKPTLKTAATAAARNYDDENDAKPVFSSSSTLQVLPDCASKKRLREYDDQQSAGQRLAKRSESFVEKSNHRKYQEMHEKLTLDYLDNVKVCNQLRSEKEVLEKRVSDLNAALIINEELNAKTSKEWEMKFEIANETLNDEVNKAKENAQKIKEEDEVEAALLEKQGQAMLEAAKKRAKHATA